jgi:hypothetical protein
MDIDLPIVLEILSSVFFVVAAAYAIKHRPRSSTQLNEPQLTK